MMVWLEPLTKEEIERRRADAIARQKQREREAKKEAAIREAERRTERHRERVRKIRWDR